MDRSYALLSFFTSFFLSLQIPIFAKGQISCFAKIGICKDRKKEAKKERRAREGFTC